MVGRAALVALVLIAGCGNPPPIEPAPSSPWFFLDNEGCRDNLGQIIYDLDTFVNGIYYLDIWAGPIPMHAPDQTVIITDATPQKHGHIRLLTGGYDHQIMFQEHEWDTPQPASRKIPNSVSKPGCLMV